MNKKTIIAVVIALALALAVAGGAIIALQWPTAEPLQQDGSAATENKILFYRNPMNPEVTSDKPMQDDMGMDYVPVYENAVK